MLGRLAIVLAGLLGLVVILVAAAFGLCADPARPGPDRGPARRQLGQPGRPAEVEGLAGLLPFDIRLGSLRLRDADGVWLEVDDARLQVRPAALLRGEIAVEQVGARPRLRSTACPRRHRNRQAVQPAAAARAAVEPAPRRHRPSCSSMPGAGPAGPRRGRDLRARRQWRHRAPTGGRAVSTSRCAGLTSRPRGSTCRPGRSAAAQSLRVDLQGSETGGLLAAATGRPEAGALRLSLTGDGPLPAGRAGSSVDAERLAKLDLAVDLAYAERRRLAVAGLARTRAGRLAARHQRHRRQPRRTGGEGCGDRTSAAMLFSSFASMRAPAPFPDRGSSISLPTRWRGRSLSPRRTSSVSRPWRRPRSPGPRRCT